MPAEAQPGVSVVMPVYNEIDCLDSVLPEVIAVCATFPAAELVVVNDGSSDGSDGLLRRYAARTPCMRVLDLSPNSGQSAAIWCGLQAARYDIAVTLDADGQNSPIDIVSCVRKIREGADVCCGYRLDRQDSLSKRLGSRLANWVRRKVLGDGIIDTGCPLKAYRASIPKGLQYWHGMHRFLPALCMMRGAKVVQIPVSHRARLAGASKYTNLGRLKVTVRDLFGVAWLKSRGRSFQCAEYHPGSSDGVR